MSDDSEDKELVKLHTSFSDSLDALYQLHREKFTGKIPDESIYRMFVGVLSQTVGRYLAAFSEEERASAIIEVSTLQEEMMELCLEQTPVSTQSKDYDLAKMKPMGNA